MSRPARLVLSDRLQKEDVHGALMCGSFQVVTWHSNSLRVSLFLCRSCGDCSPGCASPARSHCAARNQMIDPYGLAQLLVTALEMTDHGEDMMSISNMHVYGARLI